MSADQKRFLMVSAVCLCTAVCLVCGTFLLIQSFYADEDAVMDNTVKKAQNE